MRSSWIAAVGVTAVSLTLACAEGDTVSPVSNARTAVAPAADIATAAMEAAAQRNFVAVLSSTDAGTDSRGQGIAKFKLSADGTEMTYRLNVANIENLLMAHIHIAAPGSNGPVAVWLYPDGPPPQQIPGRFQGVLASGTITNANLVGPLAGMALSDLVALLEADMGYVNVHTTQHPPGEIRGQITVPRGR